MVTQQAPPVTIPLSALRSQSPSNPISSSTLLEAFGPSSLGIIIVSDLPPNFPALRARVLKSISHLAHLTPAKLSALENARARYLVGWSHGKETLRPGVIDTAKGSYYINCAFSEQDEEMVESMRQNKRWAGFDEYLAPNVWPQEVDIPEFRRDVEELVTMIVDVAGLVARAIDRWAGDGNVESWPAVKSQTQKYGEEPRTENAGYLESIVRGSKTSKARLLHYFPTEASSSPPSASTSSETSTDDSWCATHLDHSTLTGLTSAAFFDESSESAYTELPASPSKFAGLYILDRSGQTHKVSIPKDHLAFQTGEALERITKGKLKAVPHFVRGVDSTSDQGCQGRKIARNTLAVFTQPNLDDVVDLDDGLVFGDFARGIVKKNTAGES